MKTTRILAVAVLIVGSGLSRRRGSCFLILRFCRIAKISRNKLSSKSKQFSVYDEAVQSHNSKKVSGIEKHGLKTDPRVLIL